MGAYIFDGKWRGILRGAGVPEIYLRKKHAPCPFCGGKDRYRFTDFIGRGDWICNQCGTGNGLNFLERYKKLDYRGALELASSLSGAVKMDEVKEKISREDSLAKMKKYLKKTKQIKVGSDVFNYLLKRGIMFSEVVTDLREYRDEMVAIIRDTTGSGCQVHRTLIIDGVKLLMPGDLPAGSAVRLGKMQDGVIGIAEGIETALSVTALRGVTCWAAVNANQLMKWEPPIGAKSILIYGDNDENYHGQMAAYSLANRLSRGAREYVSVEVNIPGRCGDDWNDVLTKSDALRARVYR
jgi:putative DNA primase/helicase